MKDIYNMLDLRLSGVTLSDTDMFIPDPEFIKKLSEDFKEKCGIVEIGAGRGLFTKAMRDKGLKAVAIDPNCRATYETDVMQMDAMDFPYPENSLVIAARPDHSGWVETAFQRALERNCKIMYVSKLENLYIDFDEDDFEIEIYAGNVGEEKEIAWLLRGKA